MSDSTTQPDRPAASEPDPLIRTLQALVDELSMARASWDRVERHAIPLLERIAVALEQGAGSATPRDESQPERSDLGEVRAAIDEQRWDRARSILDGLPEATLQRPAVAALARELDRGHERAVVDLTGRIEAARQINDPDGALAARDELARLLPLDDLAEVDRTMIGWLMKAVQRRLRTVPVGADVAGLATAIADRFGASPEGASLRAALPTLRRSAGLCPRCAEPYLGVDDACPKCLEAAGVAAQPTPTLTFVADDLDAVVAETIPIDLNDAANWQIP